MPSPLLAAPHTLPRPADPERVKLGMARWHEAAGQLADGSDSVRRFATTLAQDSAGQTLLGTIFGNSPFLTGCLLRDLGFSQRLIEDGPAAAFDRTMAEVDALAFTPDLSRDAIKARLRVARREVALAVALADIAGVWDLEPVVRRLSRFADAALRAALSFLLRQAAAAGQLTLADDDDPLRDSGLFVLAMGKLGAYELNYSSDIDLIVLYDSERLQAPRDDQQKTCVRLVQGLVNLLEERTADGYVFRTDLRLRPDPGATPPAISVLAAETYYESLGQNWERAAMIKARVAAGDMTAGCAFLDALRPFMWRRSLDFAAIEDIQSIKRQVHSKAASKKGGNGPALAGHNIKTGRGGIREVEFFAQTQQLIWGGRTAELRMSGTLDALPALARDGRISDDAAASMAAAYRELRRIEHRLQMIDDQQTQTLPGDAAGLDALATFLGADDPAAWQRALTAHLDTVASTYRALYEEAEPLATTGSLVFTGSDEDDETLDTLTEMGFADPAAASRMVRGWHHGRVRATRSQRARAKLTEMMPRLLTALASSADPDQAIRRFDDFITGLPAGVQLFSLFHANPPLLDLVAEVVGGAPRLATWMGRNPSILDAVLEPGFFGDLPGAEQMAQDIDARLVQARDLQDVLDITRRWANDAKFQVGVHILRQLADIDRAGRAHSDIADVAIGALMGPLTAEFSAQHGHCAGRGFAVVALGKLGGRELTATSDLDLVFLYDATDAQSDGPRPLAPSHYYQRFGQRVVTALTAQTGEGQLFEVDMRLRPSGNAGPLAVRLDAFVEYQRDKAWTWEHMALTRARVVWAQDDLGPAIEAALNGLLTAPRDPDKLVHDVAQMRARLAKEKPAKGPWDLKNRRGGLIDCEFLAQYLQLKNAAEHPDVLKTNTARAFESMAATDVLPLKTAAMLTEASRLWRRLQGVLRLELTNVEDDAEWPPAVKQTLTRAAQAPDFDMLKQRVELAATAISEVFEELIDGPGGSPKT